MGRGKLNMELIQDEKSRMITYHKRKKGLTKKAREFQILCGVDACVIIFGPKLNNNRPVDVENWPTDSTEVRRIINRYRSEVLSFYFLMRLSISCPYQSKFEEVPSWGQISETLGGVLDFLKHNLNFHSSLECFARWKKGFEHQKLKRYSKPTPKMSLRQKIERVFSSKESLRLLHVNMSEAVQPYL